MPNKTRKELKKFRDKEKKAKAAHLKHVEVQTSLEPENENVEEDIQNDELRNLENPKEEILEDEYSSIASNELNNLEDEEVISVLENADEENADEFRDENELTNPEEEEEVISIASELEDEEVVVPGGAAAAPGALTPDQILMESINEFRSELRTKKAEPTNQIFKFNDVESTLKLIENRLNANPASEANVTIQSNAFQSLVVSYLTLLDEASQLRDAIVVFENKLQDWKSDEPGFSYSAIDATLKEIKNGLKSPQLLVNEAYFNGVKQKLTDLNNDTAHFDDAVDLKNNITNFKNRLLGYKSNPSYRHLNFKNVDAELKGIENNFKSDQLLVDPNACIQVTGELDHLKNNLTASLAAADTFITTLGGYKHDLAQAKRDLPHCNFRGIENELRRIESSFISADLSEDTTINALDTRLSTLKNRTTTSVNAAKELKNKVIDFKNDLNHATTGWKKTNSYCNFKTVDTQLTQIITDFSSKDLNDPDYENFIGDQNAANSLIGKITNLQERVETLIPGTDDFKKESENVLSGLKNKKAEANRLGKRYQVVTLDKFIKELESVRKNLFSEVLSFTIDPEPPTPNQTIITKAIDRFNDALVETIGEWTIGNPLPINNQPNSLFSKIEKLEDFINDINNRKYKIISLAINDAEKELKIIKENLLKRSFQGDPKIENEYSVPIIEDIDLVHNFFEQKIQKIQNELLFLNSLKIGRNIIANPTNIQDIANNTLLSAVNHFTENYEKDLRPELDRLKYDELVWAVTTLQINIPNRADIESFQKRMFGDADNAPETSPIPLMTLQAWLQYQLTLHPNPIDVNNTHLRKAFEHLSILIKVSKVQNPYNTNPNTGKIYTDPETRKTYDLTAITESLNAHLRILGKENPPIVNINSAEVTNAQTYIRDHNLTLALFSPPDNDTKAPILEMKAHIDVLPDVPSKAKALEAYDKIIRQLRGPNFAPPADEPGKTKLQREYNEFARHLSHAMVEAKIDPQPNTAPPTPIYAHIAYKNGQEANSGIYQLQTVLGVKPYRFLLTKNFYYAEKDFESIKRSIEFLKLQSGLMDKDQSAYREVTSSRTVTFISEAHKKLMQHLAYIDELIYKLPKSFHARLINKKSRIEDLLTKLDELKTLLAGNLAKPGIISFKDRKIILNELSNGQDLTTSINEFLVSTNGVVANAGYVQVNLVNNEYDISAGWKPIGEKEFFTYFENSSVEDVNGARPFNYKIVTTPTLDEKNRTYTHTFTTNPNDPAWQALAALPSYTCWHTWQPIPNIEIFKIALEQIRLIDEVSPYKPEAGKVIFCATGLAPKLVEAMFLLYRNKGLQVDLIGSSAYRPIEANIEKQLSVLNHMITSNLTAQDKNPGNTDIKIFRPTDIAQKTREKDLENTQNAYKFGGGGS